MAKLYDHKLGKYILADEDRVDELMDSGNYTFQSGEMIPVRLPDGSLGTIPSENAQAAWADGFRWPTSADKKADFDKKNDAIKRSTSMAGSTFGMSALSGASLGATDALMVGAEELGIPGTKGFKDARNLGKETSPTADLTGSVTGMAASMLIPGAAIGLAGKGAKAATGVVGAAITAKGAGGVIAREAAKGAVEGAYWGLGSGVSGAALGRPEEVVDNLVSHTLLGGLSGGVFGGALGGGKVAAPYLKKTMDAGLDLGKRAVTGAAKGIVKGMIRPVMTAKGQSAEYQVVKELMGDDAFLKLYNEGGEDAVKAIYKESKVNMAALKKESGKLDKAIKAGIDEASIDEAQVMEDVLNASGNDVRQALDRSYANLEEIGKAFDEFRPTLQGPPVFGQKLIKDIDKQSVYMGKFGPEAKALSKELNDLTKAYGTGLTEGSEIQMLRVLKAAVGPDARKKLKGAAHDTAKKLWSQLDDILKGKQINPEVSRYMKTYDTVYGANRNLNKLFSKTVGKGGGIENFLFDAQTQLKTAPILNNLKEFVPELQVIREAGDDLVKSRQAYNQLMDKYRAIAKQDIAPDNMAQFKEVIDDLVKDPKIFSSAKRIEEIQAAVQGIENLSPMDAAVKLKMALGQDVAGLEKYTKFGDKWQKAADIAKMSKGAVGHNAITLPEAAMTYAAGPIAAPFIAANKLASNPAGTLKLIASINKGAEAGRRVLSAAVTGAAKMIVNEPVARISASFVQKSMSRDQQRERYNKIRTTVADLSTPAAMSQAIEQMSGDSQNMPEIKLAIGMRIQTATQYLTSNIPADPLAAFAVGPQKSYWKPSDMEVAKFLRKAEAVDNPVQVINRLGDGTVTKDEVDAIKNVHPEIYNQLQGSIINAIMEKGDQIPYQRRVQLNLLFGIPTDYSMTPEFISKMQTTFAPTDQGGRPDGARTKNINISPFDTVQTETSRITYGDK